MIPYWTPIKNFLAREKTQRLIKVNDIDEEQLENFLKSSSKIAHKGDLVARKYVEIWKRGRLVQVPIKSRPPKIEEVEIIELIEEDGSILSF